VVALSTVKLGLFHCGTLGRSCSVAAEWVRWREIVSKNLSMDMDISVDGRVVEIEDDSCIGVKHRRARDAAPVPSRRDK